MKHLLKVIAAAALLFSSTANAAPVDYRDVFGSQIVACASNGVASSRPTCTVDAGLPNILFTCNDTDGCFVRCSEAGFNVNNTGAVINIFNVGTNLITLTDVAGQQEMIGGAAVDVAQYASVSVKYVTDRWVATGDAAGVGAFLAASGNGSVVPDTSYFSSASMVARFVDPTNGSDTLCDGKSTAAVASAPACAWASVQRALDDVPDGYVAVVGVEVVAGTFAGTNTWELHAIRGNTTGNVRVWGACTPQATFTTTGTGVALTVNSVVKMSEFTFTPTIATGTIPATIANGDFHFRRIVSGAHFAGGPIVASTTGGTTYVTVATSGTANSTQSPRMCPYSTVFSGTTTITGSKSGTSTTLSINGIKFTGTVGTHSASMNGVWVTGTTTIRAASMSGVYSTSADLRFIGASGDQSVSVTGCMFNSSTLAVLSGTLSMSANLFTGTGTKLRLGSPINSASVAYGNTFITQFLSLDFEGSGAALDMRGPVQVVANGTSGGITGCSGGIISLDITGSPINMEHGAVASLGCGGGVYGNYTSASTVKSGSNLWAQGGWTAVNTSSAGQDWTVGAQATVATASLPVTDYSTGSIVSTTGVGSTSVPVAQGGLGNTAAKTACTLVAGTCTATVVAGCECFVTPEAALAGRLRCTVSGTTATVTSSDGADVGVVNALCVGP